MNFKRRGISTLLNGLTPSRKNKVLILLKKRNARSRDIVSTAGAQNDSYPGLAFRLAYTAPCMTIVHLQLISIPFPFNDVSIWSQSAQLH